MNDVIQPRTGIMQIGLYQGGQSSIDGIADAIKLSSNENPLGPPEAAKEAFRRAAHDLHRYPPSDHSTLRNAIGEIHGLNPDRVICGAGSDEIISLLCQAYSGPGDEVIHTEHGFAMYRISALAAGATPVAVPEQERTTNVDAILAACNERTRLVFIANPNNPTGTMIGQDVIARLASGLPGRALLVLDSAYAEFVEGFDGGASLVDSRDNVAMTRTFSKLYGLGGLRVGWGYGPRRIIDALNRVRLPFNLSAAQLDTAEAALRDREYADQCREGNARMRSWLAEALADAGAESDTSHANFILTRFRDPAEARACDTFLKTRGLIVRSTANYNLPHCLRITVGDEAACRRVASSVAEFMEGRE